MANNVHHILLICERCGAIIGLGMYKPLAKAGRFQNCIADMRTIEPAEANRMLSEHQRKGGAE